MNERRCVLLVEDDIRIATALEIRLKSKGYCVMQAGTVEVAEQILSQGCVQTAIVDINLPDGNGVDLVSRLNANQDGLAPPAIVMSASRQPGLADAARQAGAIAFLEKPFNSAILLNLLDELSSASGLSGNRAIASTQDCLRQAVVAPA